ncbi:MAG: tyrosine-protein kinase family protein [Methylocella sp.]
MSDLASRFRELSLALFGLIAEGRRTELSRPLLSAAVGSARPREGRSFIVEGLALHAASLSALRLLLVDAHMANPELTNRHGGKDFPGLADVLRGTAETPELLPMAAPNLRLIGAGRAPQSALLYQDGKLRQFLAWAAARADCVLFDMPPFDAEARPVAAVVDRVLLVVDSSRTPRAVASAAISSLPTGKAWGVVLNKCPQYGPAALSASAGY